MQNYLKISTFLLASSSIFFSCSDNDEDPEVITEEPEVVVVEETSVITDTSLLLDVRLGDQTFFHFLEETQEASLNVVDAQETLGTDGAVMAFIKDDYAYLNDFTGETFRKVEVDSDGILGEVAAIPNLGTGGSALTAFLDDNTVLHSSDQFYPTDGVYSYQIIDLENMQQTTQSTFELPITALESNPDNYQMFANEYVNFEGNIYIPFVEVDLSWSLFYDEAYVAVYDATTLEYVKTITTASTASLCNGIGSSYGIDESGDLYMSSSNTNRFAANESTPSGIVRIKSGETDFDTDYFLDMTALTGFHSLSMLYVGNGKAIVQVFNTDLSDTDYDVEYYLVDLAAETADKLDLPASSNNRFAYRRTLDILGNGNAAILINHENGSSIYVYDVTTGELSEEVTYTGADYIAGIKAY